MKKLLLIALLAVVINSLSAMEGQGAPDNNSEDFQIQEKKRKSAQAFATQKPRIEKKAKHNSKTGASLQQKPSCIIKSIKNGIQEIRSLLEDAKLNVKTKYTDGKTALMLAIIHSENSKIAQLLVHSGANVNAKDNQGNTVLSYALKKGDKNLVAFLKHAGAEVNDKCNQIADTLSEPADCDDQEKNALHKILRPLNPNQRRTTYSQCEAIARKEARAKILREKERKSELFLKKLLIEGDAPIAKALFNPGANIESVLINLIQCEKESIKIAVYMLTSRSIRVALNEAKEKGVTVELIVDPKRQTELGIAYSDFFVYNPQNNSSLMHHKFAIFKDNVEHRSLICNGSYNFTNNANEENVTILDNIVLIDEFRKQFDLVKSKSKQFKSSH